MATGKGTGGRKASKKSAKKVAKKSAKKATKKSTKKSVAKKSTAKKSAAKASAAKRAPVRKPTPRKPVRKSAARKVPPGKVAARSPARASVAARAPGVVVKGVTGPRFAEILSHEALAFVADLHRRFDARRRDLLARRVERQKRFDAGELPDFLPETRAVRDGDWTVSPIPADLQDRRVEITGPVDRKMIVNALNSGAKVFMADFEDASSPTFANMVEGQINLKDRWAGKIDFVDSASGKAYRLKADPAVLMVRPRGWHLPEAHVEVDGRAVAGALFDFGLYAFHNAKAQVAQGATPAFYLPKMESHLEARLWNDVFDRAEERLGLKPGTFKATVLIETLPAAFEMDEIVHELRTHMAGLNCGRWDYIFSFIKRLRGHADKLTPDRGAMVMGRDFLGAYSDLLIKTCHRRGAFAMGGMAAQIPVKGDSAANEAAFAKVRADKEREAKAGHDGTWVAHPDLVPVAMEVFDRVMPGKNQLANARVDVSVSRDDLLKVHPGARTEAGLREDIRVGVQYIEAWLRGRGAVPLYNLMEDAATAEISRTQIWQWIRHRATLDDGREVTPALFRATLEDEMAKLATTLGPAFRDGRFETAIELFSKMSLSPVCEEFLTLPAYPLLDRA